MRKRNVPLLLSGCCAFSIFLMSWASPHGHEMIATNIIETLDLAGIPLFAEERDEEDPLIFGGGPSVWNSEPRLRSLMQFFLGDAKKRW